MRNLYAGQEATVRTGHGTTDWFQIGKGDILESEVKCALESTTINKASGGDEIPVELFQILKDDAVKGLQQDGDAGCLRGRQESSDLSRDEKLAPRPWLGAQSPWKTWQALGREALAKPAHIPWPWLPRRPSFG